MIHPGIAKDWNRIKEILAPDADDLVDLPAAVDRLKEENKGLSQDLLAFAVRNRQLNCKLELCRKALEEISRGEYEPKYNEVLATGILTQLKDIPS